MYDLPLNTAYITHPEIFTICHFWSLDLQNEKKLLAKSL